MDEDHSQSEFMKDSSQSRADKSQGGQESMFHARSWSILTPRLWMVSAPARTGSSSTPSSRSREKFGRGHYTIGKEIGYLAALRHGVHCACARSLRSTSTP